MFSKLKAVQAHRHRLPGLFKSIRFVVGLTKELTVFSLVLNLLEIGCFFLSLQSFRKLINLLTTSRLHITRAALLHQLLIIAAVAIGYLLLKAMGGYVSELNQVKITRQLDQMLHEKAISLDLAFYESDHYFNILKRTVDDALNKPQALLGNLVSIANSLFTGLGFTMVLISINWKLIPIVLLMALPSYVWKTRLNKLLYDWHLRRTELNRKLNYYRSIITGEAHAKELRLFQFGSWISQLFETTRNELTHEQLQMKKRFQLVDLFINILSTLGFLLCIGYISLSISEGKNNVGDIALLLLALFQSFNVMQTLSSSLSQIMQNQLYLSSLFEYLDLQPTVQTSSQKIPTAGTPQKLRVSQLWFSYPQTEQQVLKDINMTVEKGKLIGLAGLNGSGKSTLIKLLARLYEPDQGTISLDGKPITAYAAEDYRSLLSVVFQDFGKYQFTVGKNIQLGRTEAIYEDLKIQDAARQSGAWDYIREFPDQFHTQMGKQFALGREISTGQWQKLALARAFYRAADFLILDEATSAIDVLAENTLVELLQSQKEKMGIVLISHRLSVLKHCDYLYVLSNGCIVEEGTHSELMSGHGAYYQQFKNELSIE